MVGVDLDYSNQRWSRSMLFINGTAVRLAVLCLKWLMHLSWSVFAYFFIMSRRKIKNGT